MTEMGVGVPLLNDYKLEFFWKRFPQTVLGGLRLKLGLCGPAYVYINQLLLFFTPWLVGGIFTILVGRNVLQYDVASYIVGGLVFFFVLMVNLSGEVFKLRKRKVEPMHHVMKVLSEDDDLQFDSCCGLNSSTFMIPGKKYKCNIVLHSLMSGVVCALSFWYLLPSTLNALYNSLVATVILYIFGWLTVLISQHSLTVLGPPEPATFRTQDSLEVTPFMRHFYVMICITFHLLARSYTVFHLSDQVMHIVLAFLPVLWSFGFLSPLDALFLWIFEQSLVFLFGGSPMASDLGLVLMFVVSLAIFLTELFIPEGVVTVCIMAGCGYLLSIDISTLARQIIGRCRKRKMVIDQPSLFLWRWTYKETLFHLGMVLTVTGVAGVTNNFSRSSTSLQNAANYLAYAIAGLLTLKVILSQAQTVYVIGGLFRNPLYPKSVQRITVFHKRKKKLRILGYVHQFITNGVAPLLMLVYLSLSISFSSATTSSTVAATLGAARSFRWIWQNSAESMLDITIFSILNLALPSKVWFLQQPRGVQLLVISLCRDRTKQLLEKLFTWVTVLVKSWTDKKQRRLSTAAQILLNIVFFPVVLGILITATFISAPLLPLFTLPMFIFGYPRTTKFWPEPVGASANTCPDSVFYQHLVGRLTLVFQKGFSSGSLGNVLAGQLYLVRFQDRLVWVQVLERGYLYCSLSIKGLELQETSCHTVEAARIDDVFEDVFEKEEDRKCCFVNQFVFSTMTPRDAFYLKTYSDAKNVLTGIIDSPETLKLVSVGFVQALLWTLLHAVCNYDEVSKSFRNSKKWSKLREDTDLETPEMKIKLADESIEFRPISRSGSCGAESLGSRLDSPSIKSLGSNWSDDNESLILEPLNKGRVNLVKGLTAHITHGLVVKSSLPPVDAVEDSVIVHEPPVTARHVAVETGYSHRSNIDNLFNDLEFGMPVMDVAQEAQSQHQTGLSSKPDTKHGRHLCPPHEWLQLEINQSHLTKLTDQFPKAWYQHILNLLAIDFGDTDANEAIREIQKDKGLEKLYCQLVMSCYAIFNLIALEGTDPVSMGPSHVHKIFTGKIPWSPGLEMLEKIPELKALILKSYRFAVKMAIDQTVFGEAESLEELQEYMEEYTNNWYIGNDSDAEWEKSIIESRPTIFSMHQENNQGTFHSRSLTCQDVAVYIGELNGEMVRGQWANLVLELLYLTNDDEERYSIQAHSAILRNLTVQAADPPLGYPVYSSPPLTVPTF